MPRILPVVMLPAASLRERSKEVDPKNIGTNEFQAFLDTLIETMIESDGVGIAAPQVGRNDRVIIVSEKKGPKAYINPELTKISDELQESEEGCLSVPGVWGIVDRAKKITFTALDRHARRVEFTAKGFYATVYQHEVDHLDGVLFIDKAKKIIQGSEKIKGFFGTGSPPPRG